MNIPRKPSTKLWHTLFRAIITIGLGGCLAACSNQPDTRLTEHTQIEPRYQDAELWMKLDNEKEPEFLGMPYMPGNTILLENVPRIHHTDEPEFVIERSFAGSTDHGDVWSFKIEFADHDPVILGALYNGNVSVIHEESDYRLYFVPRNTRKIEGSIRLKDPPDWPLPEE